MKITLNIPDDTFNGYEIAQEIDRAIERILQEHPLAGAYMAKEWMKAARTIGTTAEILEEIAERKFRQEI